MDVSSKWWFFRGFFVEVVVVSLVVRRNGGFFRGVFVEMVVVSLIVRRNGSFSLTFRRNCCVFMDCSSKWRFFVDFSSS